MLLDLGNLREDYNKELRAQSDILNHPIEQFKIWIGKAKEVGVPEPNAMTLATCTADGKPSARIVLLKGIEPRRIYLLYQLSKSESYRTGGQPSCCFGIPLAFPASTSSN